MSNKKVFAHGLSNNALDVINKKKANNLLKFHKKQSIDGIMNRFRSYEEFILLVKQFYFINRSEYNLQIPESLRNSNTTFIIYNQVRNHINSCNDCQQNSNIFLSNCITLKQILYPYGLYISNDAKKKIYLHGGIDLKNFCLLNKEQCFVPETSNLPQKQKIDYSSCIFFDNNDNSEKINSIYTTEYKNYQPIKIQTTNKQTTPKSPILFEKNYKLEKPDFFQNKEEEIYYNIKNELLVNSGDNSNLVLVDNIVNNIKNLGEAQKMDFIKNFIHEMEIDLIFNSLVYKEIENLIQLSLDEKDEELVESFKSSKSEIESSITQLNNKIKLENNKFFIDFLKNSYYSISIIVNAIEDLSQKDYAIDKYKKDSEILNNREKLKSYLESIKSYSIEGTSIAVAAISLKREYEIYHEQYGIPNKLIYDPILLENIKKQL